MSGWIKFWKDMPNDPRVLSAAVKLSKRYILARRSPGGGSDLSSTETCNAWRNAVTGAIATLWCYADEHIRDDDTLPLTSQTLDAIVGLEGFFDAMPREWIDELDDGIIILPGYCEKNSLIAKRKRTVKSNARVTQWRRAKNAKCNGVTGKHVTQHIVAGDLDQDSDSDKKKISLPSEAPVASKRDDAALTVFVHWQQEWKHPTTKLDQKRRKRIEARLKDFTPAQLRDAISGFKHSPWHTGTDPKGNGTVYDSIDTLLRDSAQVEKGIGLFAHPPRPPPKAETAHDRMQKLLNGDNSQVIEHDPGFPAISGH